MRVRKVDASGDMLFGSNTNDYWYNVPEAVAQSIMTRLRLFEGEWFVDLTEGTPWATQVLGERTQSTRDVVVRSRVFGTPHVIAITEYGSRYDGETRTWGAAMTIDTDYGRAGLAVARLPGELPSGSAGPSVTGASLLGVQGTVTPITMTAANLLQGPNVSITNFQIIRLDAGAY
jgi:hypothetical protein